eukprot:7567931-Pyramimonas_sp.AAC.1
MPPGHHLPLPAHCSPRLLLGPPTRCVAHLVRPDIRSIRLLFKGYVILLDAMLSTDDKRLCAT